MLAHEFTLVNKLPAAVKIVEMKTSCGCLVPSKIVDTIAPGERVTLPVRFTTGIGAGEQPRPNESVPIGSDGGASSSVPLRACIYALLPYRCFLAVQAKRQALGAAAGLDELIQFHRYRPITPRLQICG
jgi:hypothetical protein